MMQGEIDPQKSTESAECIGGPLDGDQLAIPQTGLIKFLPDGSAYRLDEAAQPRVYRWDPPPRLQLGG
jgi:hypothetical protein